MCPRGGICKEGNGFFRDLDEVLGLQEKQGSLGASVTLEGQVRETLLPWSQEVPPHGKCELSPKYRA